MKIDKPTLLPFRLTRNESGIFYIQMDGTNAGKPFKERPLKGNYYAVNILEDQLDPLYFWYFIEYLYTSGKFKPFIRGTTVPHLTVQGFNTVVIDAFLDLSNKTK